jgi:hypothetical protein
MNQKQTTAAGDDKLVNPRTLARANKAISDLIVECLASNDPLKFATAERLANVGQQLRKAMGMRAADHMSSHSQAPRYAMYQNGPDDDIYEMQGAEIIPRPRTPGDALRNPQLFDSLLAGIRTALEPAQRAQNAEHESREIMTLIKAIPDAPDGAKQIMQARLDQLLRAMNERNQENAKPLLPIHPTAPQPAVVLPDLERGHSARTTEQGRNGGAVREPDADRVQGTAGAARPRREGQLGRAQGLRA